MAFGDKDCKRAKVSPVLGLFGLKFARDIKLEETSGICRPKTKRSCSAAHGING